MAISLPTNFFMFTAVASFAALKPKSLGLKQDPICGEIITLLDNADARVSSHLFVRMIQIFKDLSKIFKPCEEEQIALTAMHVWAYSESTGQAKALLEKELPVSTLSIKEPTIPLPSAQSIDYKICQVALNILHVDRCFTADSILFFSTHLRTTQLQEDLVKYDFVKAPFIIAKDGSLRFDLIGLETINCYLLALLLKHKRRLIPVDSLTSTNGGPSTSLILPQDIALFLEDSQKLENQHLLGASERNFIKGLKIVYEHDSTCRLKVVGSNNLFHTYLSNHIQLKANFPDIWNKESVVQESLEWIQDLTKKLEDVKDLYIICPPEEIKVMLQHTFSVIKHLPQQMKRYEELWQRVSDKRTLAHVIYKKNIFTAEALPAPREHQWTYQSDTQKKKSVKKNKKHSSHPTVIRTKIQTKEEIYPKKVDIPSKEEVHQEDSPYLYHERVRKYFSDLDKNGTTQDERFHGFALAVDPYMEKYGIKDTWLNPTTGQTDTLWRIPCEVEYQGKITRGEITYCIAYNKEDAAPICYHRWITKRTTQEILQSIEKQSWEWNFPELQQAVSQKPLSKHTAIGSDRSFVLSERDNVVEIKDPRNDSIIRLFLIEPNKNSFN